MKFEGSKEVTPGRSCGDDFADRGKAPDQVYLHLKAENQMQITACSPGRLRVSRGNTLAKPTATLLGWYHRLLPSALVRSLRIHKRPADAPESRGDLAGSTDGSGKSEDTRKPEIPPMSVPSSAQDSSPEAVNDKSARGGGRGRSLYEECLSAFWRAIFEPYLTPNPPEERADLHWLLGCWCCWDTELQLGPKEREGDTLEGQRQRQSKELNFEPAEWAFPTSICDLMFSSCIAHHSPLHEHVEGSADSREDENAAAVNSLQRTLWSDTNLQLACGTRCRSLRRVKDEGRQVWMEYQEVTLRDNSKRFQWVELADNAKAAVQ